MTESEESVEVKFSLNIKKIRFNDMDSTLFLIRDSTDEEKLHRTLVEQKYRGMLLATITHELKTPLMTISGNLEVLLQNERLPKDLQPDVRAALMATRSLKYYLRDICVRTYNNTMGRM